MSSPCKVGHVGLRLGNIPYFVDFFHTVFGMSVTRVQGPEENPTSVWLDGGIQLVKECAEAPCSGGMHHLCILVEDVETTIALAAPYGAAPVEGKEKHWFTIPGGVNFELKTK